MEDIAVETRRGQEDLHNENLRIESLDSETLGKILMKLLPVPNIEDYWIAQFLGRTSKKFPNEIPTKVAITDSRLVEVNSK